MLELDPLQLLFFCDECGKSYTLKSNLTVHINSVHKGVKHQCGFCETCFYSKSNLLKHVKSIHQNKTFPCVMCNYEAT